MTIDQAIRGAVMDDVIAPTRRKPVPWVVALVVVVLLVLSLVLVLAVPAGRDNRKPSTTPTRPVQVPSQAAFRWESVGGVQLPVSAAHGPRDESDGRASGYSRSEKGVALAAAQVLLRTSATSGSGVFLPVIASQVTGANTAAFKAATLAQYEELRAQSRTTAGAPIPGADARVAGYRIDAYADDRGTATVDVILDSPGLRSDARLISFAVSLQWSYDDWRVLAPPRGDWGTVSTQLGTPPAGMLAYDQIG